MMPMFIPGKILDENSSLDWSRDQIHPYFHNHGFTFCETMTAITPEILIDRIQGKHRLTIYADKTVPAVALIFKFGASLPICVPFVPGMEKPLCEVITEQKISFASLAVVSRLDRQTMCHVPVKIDNKTLLYLKEITLCLKDTKNTNKYIESFENMMSRLSITSMLVEGAKQRVEYEEKREGGKNG